MRRVVCMKTIPSAHERQTQRLAAYCRSTAGQPPRHPKPVVIVPANRSGRAPSTNTVGTQRRLDHGRRSTGQCRAQGSNADLNTGALRTIEACPWSPLRSQRPISMVRTNDTVAFVREQVHTAVGLAIVAGLGSLAAVRLGLGACGMGATVMARTVGG
jgi:hypothetical protein